MTGRGAARPEDHYTLGRDFGQLRGPLHWPSLTRAEAAEALASLEEWVRQLVARFALDVRSVPPCWTRHPALVEILSALRDHERGSYADTAAPTAGIDFIRALHDATHILGETVARAGCTAHEHRHERSRPWDTPDARTAQRSHRPVDGADGGTRGP
jgi:hypothetical protein